MGALSRRTPPPGWKLITAAITAACLAGAADAHAATFVVDKTTDDAGGGACAAAANDCSLRSATMKANSVAGDDTITLAATTYHLLAAAEPVTGAGVTTIAGAGARTTAIDGGNAVAPLLNINAPSGSVNVSDLKLTNAHSDSSIHTTVAITDAQPVTLSRVAIVDNTAAGFGVSGGAVNMSGMLVARNTGRGAGGGLMQGASMFATIRDSTITDNTALPADPARPVAFTGGVVSAGVLSVSNSTIANNHIDPSASALGGDNLTSLSDGSSLTVLNLAGTIVAGAPGANCGGPIISGGHNLDSDGTCGLHALSDVNGLDPGLLALADNGGPTDTRALASSSRAIDAGGAQCGATDQRGTARPAGGACDIGAFESPFTAPPAPTPPGATQTATTPASPTQTVTTPAPPTPAVTDATPARLTLSGVPASIRRAALNKGLKMRVTPSEAVSLDASLLFATRKVTIAKAFNLTAAGASLPRAAGTRTITLRPRPKLTRRTTVQLRLVAIDAGGNRTVVTRTIRVT